MDQNTETELTLEQLFALQRFRSEVQKMDRKEVQEQLLSLFEKSMHMDNHFRQLIMSK